MARPQMGQNGHHSHQNGHPNGAMRAPLAGERRRSHDPRHGPPKSQFPRNSWERGGIAGKGGEHEGSVDLGDAEFAHRISTFRKVTFRLVSSIGLVVGIASFYGAVISTAEGWKFEKAFFLAFTVLSTIGYGNYGPTDDGSRVFLTIFTLPGVVIFAYALAQLAQVIIGIIKSIRRWLGLVEQVKPPPIGSRAKVLADTLRGCDKDGDGTITLEEIESSTGKICAMLGMDVGKQSAKAQEEARQFIEDAFNEADADGSGDLDMLEAMCMLCDLVKVRELQQKEQNQRDQIKGATYSLIPLCIIGALVFWSVEETWSALDAFYFTVISVSTVGLGDLTPSEGGGKVFWYIFMTITLGLMASIIQTLGSLLGSMSAREDIAGKRKENKDGDGESVVSGRRSRNEDHDVEEGDTPEYILRL